MAWTLTTVDNTVFGNKRTKILKVTADSAEANLETGLSVIDGFSVGIVSAATAALKMAYNSGSAGTALAGYMGVSGAASGDVFFLTVYGR